MKPEDWFFAPPDFSEDKITLICLPFAGSGASSYSSWKPLLPDHIHLLPIQLPGRETRFNETPFTDLTVLVETLTSILEPNYRYPWALFGHSMGAIIAYELAAKAAELGLGKPEHLFVSAKSPPHLNLDEKAFIGGLEDQPLLEALAKRYGADTSPLQQELLSLMLGTIRADIQMIEGFNRSEADPICCPISCFKGVEDVSVTTEEMQRWEQCTNKGYDLIELPGGHFNLQTASHSFIQHIHKSLPASLLA